MPVSDRLAALVGSLLMSNPLGSVENLVEGCDHHGDPVVAKPTCGGLLHAVAGL
jgi:hypothetical protein